MGAETTERDGPVRAGADWEAWTRAVDRMAAGAPAAEVLDVTDGATWPAFDAAMRADVTWTGRRLRARVDLPETRLCHHDGRQRQAALLGAAAEPRLWPLVVVRCADWVEPVRTAARRELERILAEAPGRAVPELLPPALRVARRERGRWLAARFEEAVAGLSYTALTELRAHPDRWTRRFAVRHTLAGTDPGAEALAREAASESDSLIRVWYAEAAATALAAPADRAEEPGSRERARELLLGARSAKVRAVGITSLRGAGRGAEAGAWLGDRSGLVRACARWLCRQDGGDPVARVRALVADPATVTGPLVASLAESGDRGTDVPLLIGLLDHPEGRVRAAAVAGLRAFEVVPSARITELVADPWPAVTREATLTLRAWPDRVRPEDLAAWRAPDRPAHVRRAGIRLTPDQGRGERLRSWVGLLTDPDPEIARWAEREVIDRGAWQAVYRAKALDRAELRALYERCRELLGEDRVERIRRALDIPAQVRD
ncbi:hypothetical protein ACN20G_22655 [Streptomyces sp. BI20]|uniref:hypothetical protein n=1 Tax=Streptomyces sp. BI20 TaxID=3403460 RepID=UPI003C78C66C